MRASNIKSTVPITHTTILLSMASAQGINTDKLLLSAGLDPDDFFAQEHLCAERFSLLYQKIVQKSLDEYFGMLSQGKVPIGTLRTLCHTVLHSSSLQQAICRIGDFHEICRGAQVKPVISHLGSHVKVSFLPINGSDYYSSFAFNSNPEKICNTLFMFSRFISWLIGKRIEIKEANFAFKEPENRQIYKKMLRTSLKFYQKENALIFPAYYLDSPLVQSEANLRDFLKTAPLQLLSASGNTIPMKVQVANIVARDFSKKSTTARKVADLLNMSVSTLRRRLNQEETSFKEIKDECRCNTVLRFMSPPISAMTKLRNWLVTATLQDSFVLLNAGGE